LLRKAVPHELTALPAAEVRAVGARQLHELADLREAHGVEPALSFSALHGNAIGLHLVLADGLVGAFVAEDPKLHRRGEPGEEVRIEDDEPAIGAAEILVVRVEDRRKGTAGQRRPSISICPAGAKVASLSAA
jgi:hypothetical protein